MSLNYRKSTHTTQYNPRFLLQPRQCKVQDITTNIIEIDIQIAHVFLKIFIKRLALVVYSLVDTEFRFEPVAFLVWPSYTDYACAFELSYLTDYGSSSPGRTGDDESFTRLDLANVEETLIDGYWVITRIMVSWVKIVQSKQSSLCGGVRSKM